MNGHYSEADLLETYYTQPGESMPVMMHLADCSDCAARYARLEQKLHSIAACDSPRPETFWQRQRLQVMRRIGQERSKFAGAVRVTRIAAGAAFAFLLGGAVMYKAVEPALEPPVLLSSAPVARATRPAVPVTGPAAKPDHDAWQSDELKDFHSVVGWETWVDSSGSKGDPL